MENSKTRVSVLPLLMDAAFADSYFKVLQSIFQRGTEHCCMPREQRDEVLYPSEKLGTLDQHRFDRNHPFYRACDEARELCEQLGRFCQKNNVDLSDSLLVKNLYFKAQFSEQFEAGRVVHCEVLSPKVLHDSVEKRNVLHWQGWTITAGKEDECDDAYGLPTFVRPLVAEHNNGKAAIELWLPGESSSRAKQAFSLITGSPFVGDDGLEDDLSHMYERMCGGY
ncbi:hypothetical protein ACI77O_12895 [Pseudomonas tritici]|uniref:hypothetical protein n=1 Tax=Pseudomonas tritici TaxID=2745518 RepID=UPI00387AD549